MKAFLVKVHEGMLERWRAEAKKRKVTLSQMIREAVNHYIDGDEPFKSDCKNAASHTAGTKCRWCKGVR